MRNKSQSEVVKRWLRFSVVALIAIQPISTLWHSSEASAEVGDPGVVSQLAPIEDAYTADNTVSLEWDAILDSTGYQYQVSTAEDFAVLVDSGATENPVAQLKQLEDGHYFWQVRPVMTDASSPEWTDAAVHRFTIDTLPPTAIDITPTNDAVLHATPVTFSATMRDTNPGVVSLTTNNECGSATNNADGSITVALSTTDLEAERCIVTANGNDKAGNAVPETIIKYSVDTQGPVITINSPDTVTNDDTLTISRDDKSTVSSCVLEIVEIVAAKSTETDELTVGPQLKSLPDCSSLQWGSLGLQNGLYRVGVTATDRWGNETSKVKQVRLANLTPSALFSITSSSPSATNDAELTLQGQTTPGSVVEILTVMGDDIGQTIASANGFWSYKISVTSAGSYSYQVRVTDGFGNSTLSAVQTILIAPYTAATSGLIDGDITKDLTQSTAFNAILSQSAIVPPTMTNDLTDDLKRSEIDQPAVLAMDTTPVAASTVGWKFYGVTWYWWGVLALLAAAGWRFIYRRQHVVEDLPPRRMLK